MMFFYRRAVLLVGQAPLTPFSPAEQRCLFRGAAAGTQSGAASTRCGVALRRVGCHRHLYFAVVECAVSSVGQRQLLQEVSLLARGTYTAHEPYGGERATHIGQKCLPSSRTGRGVSPTARHERLQSCVASAVRSPGRRESYSFTLSRGMHVATQGAPRRLA
jgi:hypothetical protein